MVATRGLIGLRPSGEHVSEVTSPPYDVIKRGSKLEALLAGRARSLFHVILGDEPKAALAALLENGSLVRDDEPAYYVYEQNSGGQTRTGIFIAAEVSDYSERNIIRHEKTFDEKVKGRIALTEETGHTIGPVFALSKAPLAPLLEDAKAGEPLYDFESDFGGENDLHGIHSRVFRVPSEGDLGRRIGSALAPHPLYIADGHHRYHAALKNEQTHFLCYVTSEATIQAYDRVVNGVTPFSEVRASLDLEPAPAFATPPRHTFCLYDGKDAYSLAAQEVPMDVVGRLDCSILEREVYPSLGLSRSMIADPAHFDYYPESALDAMKEVVDRGEYDLAIALHPVSIEELMAVADAGLEDPDVVMPEKSTFFAPKILTGLFLYRHSRR